MKRFGYFAKVSCGNMLFARRDTSYYRQTGKIHILERRFSTQLLKCSLLRYTKNSVPLDAVHAFFAMDLDDGIEFRIQYSAVFTKQE